MVDTPTNLHSADGNLDGRVQLGARLILLLIASGLGIWIARCALWPEAHYGAVRLIPWQTWPPFGDLRIVLEACDFSRGGGDPLRSSELHYNYPRIWLSLRHLGLTVADTTWLGLTLDAAFLACIVRLAWHAAPAAVVLTAAAIATPPVMTALERANTDLVVFVLLSVSASLAAKTKRVGFGAGGLALAAALKIYPAFALPALRAPASQSAQTYLVAGSLIVAGVAYQFSDLSVVAEKTPQAHIYTYGASVPTLRLQAKGLLASHSTAAAVVTALSVAGAASLMVVAFCFGRRSRGSTMSVENGPALSLLSASGLIFAATFFLTSNWFYRLVFLLWSVPLLPWKTADAKIRAAGRIAACAVVALLWTYAWPTRWGFAASHAAALCVLALFAYLAGHLAPSLRPTQQ